MADEANERKVVEYHFVHRNTAKNDDVDDCETLDGERINPKIIESITSIDVLCGRGKPSFNHRTSHFRTVFVCYGMLFNKFD
jgi:hypothetical protein